VVGKNPAVLGENLAMLGKNPIVFEEQTLDSREAFGVNPIHFSSPSRKPGLTSN
jgi:hypothetical protein